MWLDGTSLMLTSAFAAIPLHRSCLRHSRSLVFTTHGKEAGSGQHGDRMRQVTRRKGDPPRPLRLRSRSSCPHFSLTPPFDPTPCHLLPIPPSFPSPLPLLPSLRLPSLPFHFLSLSNGQLFRCSLTFRRAFFPTPTSSHIRFYAFPFLPSPFIPFPFLSPYPSFSILLSPFPPHVGWNGGGETGPGGLNGRRAGLKQRGVCEAKGRVQAINQYS